MSDVVETVLTRLTRVAGVRGAIVVDAEAGVPVAADVAPGVPETAMAALAGSLHSQTRAASETAGVGALKVLQLEAALGHLLMVGAGPLLVVVLMEPGAQLGLVRVRLAHAAKELMP